MALHLPIRRKRKFILPSLIYTQNSAPIHGQMRHLLIPCNQPKYSSYSVKQTGASLILSKQRHRPRTSAENSSDRVMYNKGLCPIAFLYYQRWQ